MSEFKPNIMWLKEKINNDEYRQNIRNKYLKFIEENPEMDAYFSWRDNQKICFGIIMGFLLTFVILLLFLEGVIIGRM